MILYVCPLVPVIVRLHAVDGVTTQPVASGVAEPTQPPGGKRDRSRAIEPR